MFVRKKRNKSGSFSVQIIRKVGRVNKLVKTIGSSKDPKELKLLERQAQLEVEKLQKQANLFSSHRDQDLVSVLSNTPNDCVQLVGPDRVLGAIYDQIGYSQIPDDGLLRELVISRLVYPGSKLKTVDFLARYKGMDISVYSIYRYMDKLNSEYQDVVEEITFSYFKKILGGKVGIVFYDMTTLYFETPEEDDIRRIGYSKDGKHQHPQIKLGVLVGANGFPIGYDIFDGSQYEGHTLIPILKQAEAKFNIGKPMVIADAGLLTNRNIKALIASGYEFVLGGRIKNESEDIKSKILELDIKEGKPEEISKEGHRLIMDFSSKRAKKDRFNRERGLNKLEKRVKSGKLDKNSINNRGYNKYLKLESEVKVSIDYGKFQKDEKWDGLKGYLTNSKLSPKDAIAAYNNLWHIEKAFRISKTDLKVRPIYHRLPDRIHAHICICFLAYAVFKELERKLEINKINISPYRAVELTRNMYQISVVLPDSKIQQAIPLKMTEQQQALFQIFS